ncbi:protein-serine O-palmitoleoyltransferase porcupine-like [Acropora millepora]|uniref:protein-serine O-palmitoleoyltransferase porcupine-like n=1 Tax=Acropora millepora TaxID=45264 RepID=UPI001CF39B65|nr:protein-serine O-palmitoleoyltransferase porcupine-like [Acropora millepora]
MPRAQKFIWRNRNLRNFKYKIIAEMDEVELADFEDQDLIEYYDDPDELALYKEYEDLEKYGRFLYMFKSCVGPTTSQTVNLVGPLLAMCLVFRIIALMRLPNLLVHFVSFICGTAALFLFVKDNTAYPLVMCALGYPVLFLKYQKRGMVMGLLCVTFLIVCELFIVTAQNWHQVRGSQMVLVMKLISLAFDMDNALVQFRPNIVEYFGYALSVSSVIFGPFMTYTEYCQILVGKKMSLAWFVGVIRSCVLSYCCLIMSSCVAMWIFPEDAFKWFLAYQAAMSFRFSHYFVSFLSECTSLLSGIGMEVNQKGKQETIWRLDVARPQHVELPRSLVEVVVHWNIPMHVFLKNYVYKKAQPLGRFVAVLLTFALSSLLHGINFQLAAVLISIGTYAYIEHVFRKKLGGIFDACIMARKCKAGCGHRYTEANFWIIATNLGFSFLSMFHLAYLGIMFGGDTELQERGYGMMHTLSKWSHLDFASHWVAFATFLLSRVIL